MKHSLTRGDYLFASAILFALVVSIADCVIIQHFISNGLLAVPLDIMKDFRIYWLFRSIALLLVIALGQVAERVYQIPRWFPVAAFGVVSLIPLWIYVDSIMRAL